MVASPPHLSRPAFVEVTKSGGFCIRISALTQVDFTYSAFGLLLRSNLAIPGLLPSPFCSSVSNVHVKLGEGPDVAGENRPERKTLIFKSSYLNEAGDPALKVWSVADGAMH